VADLVGVSQAAVQPDTRTFNALIRACRERRQWQLAMAFFAEMQERHLKVREFVCGGASKV